MTESPELAVLVHELGGMLSSVQGFAHIAAENPDHPDRERFIKLAASEARRAAQTVKDIHLVRAFDRGRIDPAPGAVDLGTMFDAPGAAGVQVVADAAKAKGVLDRCVEKASAPPEVVTSRELIQVRIPIAPATELTRKVEALDAPYPDMVTYAILRRLLRHWRGDVTLATEGDATVAVLSFAPR
jgi:hypothetical protein